MLAVVPATYSCNYDKIIGHSPRAWLANHLNPVANIMFDIPHECFTGIFLADYSHVTVQPSLPLVKSSIKLTVYYSRFCCSSIDGRLFTKLTHTGLYSANSPFALSYLRMLINIWLLWGAFGLLPMQVSIGFNVFWHHF